LQSNIVTKNFLQVFEINILHAKLLWQKNTKIYSQHLSSNIFTNDFIILLQCFTNNVLTILLLEYDVTTFFKASLSTILTFCNTIENVLATF